MKYALWTGNDYSGFEADTVEEVLTMIAQKVWWTGRMDIVENATGIVVLSTVKADASKELKAFQEAVNAIEEE